MPIALFAGKKYQRNQGSFARSAKMQVLSNLELAKHWPRHFVTMADARYALPTKKWFLKVAAKHAFDRGSWRKAFDCDDFAMSLKLKTQELHAKVAKDVDGLAVGVCFYMQDKGGGHAINWAINRNGLYFVEPQTGREVWLSDSEFRSVYFVYV